MNKGMITLSERTQAQQEFYRRMLEAFGAEMRVAAPGIIQSFDPDRQTVTVQLAITERVILNGNAEGVAIKPLLDVPVFMPRAGGYVLTMPITAGDECLVVFGDSCMDAWYQSGGVQNQMDRRRHDLSDGFALVGVWSQPRTVAGYSTDSAQLRNEAGSSYVEIKGDTINIKAGETINLEAGTAVNIHAPLLHWAINALTSQGIGGGAVGAMTLHGNSIVINGEGSTTIDEKNFLNHEHTGVYTGSENTGGVA